MIDHKDKQITIQLGKNLVAERRRKDVTQERLAELTDLGRRTIQSIELGERWPRPATLLIIAKVLKIPFENLFKNIK